MNHLGLFEGIGGFSLAVKWAGGKTLAWCEWNEFGQKVLRHHFPEAEGFGDITKTNFKKYEGQIDILTGGFPCQPFSLAGKRKGADDERYLWHEMLRAIQEVKPTYVIAENVYGIVSIDGGVVFEQVCADLENEGYEVQAFVIPACAKNAPHRRDRVWFVAYSDSNRKMVQRRNRNSNNAKRNSKEKIQERSYKQPGINGTSFLCNASNSQSKGSSGKLQQRQRQGEFRGCDSTGITTNPNSIRQPCKKHRQTEPRWTSEKSIPNDWQNFPTQSPICSGDDGLPTKLDGITFPKWRNESIKAYGNAIVPQVAYEIIKQLLRHD